MPVLVRLSKNDKKQAYRIGYDKGFSIGRKEFNDLVLDDCRVSDFHAEIEIEKDKFILTDQFSKTGTFINNQIILSRTLNHKDTITIGRQRLVFFLEKGERQTSSSENFSTRETIAIDSRQYRDKLMKNVLRIANKDRVDKKTIGVITFTDSKRPSFIIKNDEITLGRSRKNDIQIKGFFLAKIVAIIRKKGNQFFLLPRECWIKPKLNYSTVRSETPIHELDVITIGSCEMQFRLKKISD